MMRNGTAYRLPPLVPRTNEIGCLLFPTPKASDADRGGRGELLALVRGKKTRQMWPTPGTPSGGRTVRRRERPDRDRPSNLEEMVAITNPEAIGGQMNPQWVEWLMGFPLEWTDLEDSETP